MLTTLALAGHGAGFGFGLFFVLIPLFFLMLLAILFAIFGRRMRRHSHYGHWAAPTRGAESSLAERFAQGDIDEKEYRARLEVLRASSIPQHSGRV